MCQLCRDLIARLRADDATKYTIHWKELQYPRALDRSRWRRIDDGHGCCHVWHESSSGGVRIYSRHPSLSDPVWFPDGGEVYFVGGK